MHCLQVKGVGAVVLLAHQVSDVVAQSDLQYAFIFLFSASASASIAVVLVFFGRATALQSAGAAVIVIYIGSHLLQGDVVLCSQNIC